MTTCTNCGSSLAAGDQFCGACGTPSAAAGDTATTVTVDVPEWLTADWGAAAKWAGAAALAAIIGHFIVLVVLFLGTSIINGFDLSYMDWGAFLQTPVQVMLAMHGAVQEMGTWLTGIAWIAGSLFITKRVIASDQFARVGNANPWATISMRAFKVALIYAGIIIVGLIVFKPATVVGDVEFFASYSPKWNAAAGFFVTLLVVSLAAAAILMSLRHAPGGPRRDWGVWAAGFRGTLRILLVGMGGIFLFFLVAGLLVTISDAQDFFAEVVGGLLILLVAALAWTGIDVGLFFMAEAMRFFSGDVSNDVFGAGSKQGWFLVATLIVAVAFAVGGYRAARLTGSRQLSKMLQAAGIAGGGVALTYLVATVLVGQTLPNMGAGIGLSILWTVVAAGGALIYAQSVGALQKVNVNIQRSIPAANTCPNCGAMRVPDQAFCANCGNRF